ncbi:DUF6118 family protein [Phenylobacterium sp.]|uniref:DUF6118 family protein n=1 Tax=Phenylobacterium sp. TaxID=1871053 RepID=UPI003BAA240A
MSLQPSDPASEAFERLRLEVALLRRAVEGLAADAGAEPVDYSPTLARLSKAVAEVDTQVTALGERPVLALAPDQLGSLFQMAAARVLARPVVTLEREQAVLNQATEALRAARQAEMARAGSWRRMAGLLAAGALAGALVWGLLLGPLARMLPASWAAPERLAAATLAQPMTVAGEQLLSRGDPQTWETVMLVRRLPDRQRSELGRCISSWDPAKAKSCTLKLRAE